MVSIKHKQKSIFNQTQLDEQTIICRQLFAGHVVGSANEKEETFPPLLIIKNVLYIFDDSPKQYWQGFSSFLSWMGRGRYNSHM